MTENVAVLHGNYFARGGGERVADAIADAFDAPLYYGFGDGTPDDDRDRRKLFDPTWLGKRLAEHIYQWRDFRFMTNSTHLPELHEYDCVIQSGNEFGWYVPYQATQPVVKYVHSPPRGPYDLHHRHGGSLLHRAYSLAAKVLYEHTLTYPDVYVANSEVVARRCQKAWGVTPEIVYPPVDVDNYGPEHGSAERPDTYLTFSRLYRHKRTREIVQAFEHLPDCQLIVGGDGPQRETLERLAPDNVDVRGYLPEDEKRTLLAECQALIFNARSEDFGIVPIEAFASGTPVIGVNEGFTRYQIRDGENGYLYDDGEAINSLWAAIDYHRTNPVAWDSDQLQAYADQFSRQRFESEMQAVVDRAIAADEIEPKVSVPEVQDA